MDKENQIGELRRQLREAAISGNEVGSSGSGSGSHTHTTANPAPGQPSVDSTRHVSSLQALELSKMSDEMDALRTDREGKVATLNSKLAELQRELEEKSRALSSMEKLLFTRDKENNAFQYENDQIRCEVQTWREKARLSVEEASALRDQLRETVNMMDMQRSQMLDEQVAEIADGYTHLQQQQQRQQHEQEEKQQQYQQQHQQQQQQQENEQIQRLQAQLSKLTHSLDEEKDKVGRWSMRGDPLLLS